MTPDSSNNPSSPEQQSRTFPRAKSRSPDFQALLDSLEGKVAVLDQQGTIIATNEAWRSFARENGLNEDPGMVGADYLSSLKDLEDHALNRIRNGLQAIFQGQDETFKTVHSCPSSNRKRRFEIRAARLEDDHATYVTVTQRDVTDRRHPQQNPAENTTTKEKLRRRIEEKEILLQEVLHRTKNNLQVIIGLLNLQSRRATNPEIAGALRDAVLRVHTMALIHEQLFEDFNFTDGFSDYLEDLIDKILESHRRPNQTVDVDLDIDDTVQIDMSTAITCGLIINELVTNALLHAFSDDQTGLLNVSFFTDDEGNLHLVVADNGSGMDPSNLEENDTLGFNLVRSMAKSQLDGDIEASQDEGLKIEVIFPPKKDTNEETLHACGKVRESESN